MARPTTFTMQPKSVCSAKTGNRIYTSYFFHFGTGTQALPPTNDTDSFYGMVTYSRSTRTGDGSFVPNRRWLGTEVSPANLIGSYKPRYIDPPSTQLMAMDATQAMRGLDNWRNHHGHRFVNNHFRQRGGHNLMFMDMHVEWKTRADVDRFSHRDFYNRFYYYK